MTSGVAQSHNTCDRTATQDHDLAAAFLPYGTVEHAEVALNMRTGASLRHGAVTLASPDSIEDALAVPKLVPEAERWCIEIYAPIAYAGINNTSIAADSSTHAVHASADTQPATATSDIDAGASETLPSSTDTTHVSTAANATSGTTKSVVLDTGTGTGAGTGKDGTLQTAHTPTRLPVNCPVCKKDAQLYNPAPWPHWQYVNAQRLPALAYAPCRLVLTVPNKACCAKFPYYY